MLKLTFSNNVLRFRSELLIYYLVVLSGKKPSFLMRGFFRLHHVFFRFRNCEKVFRCANTKEKEFGTLSIFGHARTSAAKSLDEFEVVIPPFLVVILELAFFSETKFRFVQHATEN